MEKNILKTVVCVCVCVINMFTFEIYKELFRKRKKIYLISFSEHMMCVYNMKLFFKFKKLSTTFLTFILAALRSAIKSILLDHTEKSYSLPDCIFNLQVFLNYILSVHCNGEELTKMMCP